MSKDPSRRQQILQALAHMLEAGPGERITTAGLAKTVKQFPEDVEFAAKKY